MKYPLPQGILKLNRRPPNYKINTLASNPEEIKLEGSFQYEDENNDKKEQIIFLQKKLKLLEKQLEQREQEIESLHKETSKIVKERDMISSKYKELREHEQYEEEDDEEFNQFTRALANAFHSAQEAESPEDQEGEGEGDDTNYKYMLMAMANHLLSEEMEREELDEAIKMSMNPS